MTLVVLNNCSNYSLACMERRLGVFLRYPVSLPHVDHKTLDDEIMAIATALGRVRGEIHRRKGVS